MKSWKYFPAIRGRVPAQWESGSLVIRKHGKKWYLSRVHWTGPDTVLGAYDTKEEAQTHAETLHNPKGLTAKGERMYKHIAKSGRKRYGKRAKSVAAATVRKFYAKPRRARRRNPATLSESARRRPVPFFYHALQGEVVEIRYRRSRDGKLYYHQFNEDTAPALWLTYDGEVGGQRTIHIVGDVPLWGDKE